MREDNIIRFQYLLERIVFFFAAGSHLVYGSDQPPDYGYMDEELKHLWSSVVDITHPTLDEYRLIENYISYGERPYLTELYFRHSRIKMIRNFKLIGPEGQMPIIEKYSFNVTEKTKQRCILLFTSPNGIYPQKARRVLSEIEKCGYSGHVLLRIGGFPNTEFGGLKLAHVPYAFKVAFLREAQLLGYKEVLWIDTAIHPLTDLELVFKEIETHGYFLLWIGSLASGERLHYLSAAKSLGISKDSYEHIRHISSAMIGLKMDHPQAIRCLESWYRATQRVYPNISGYPEELGLSVSAWRAKCTPYSWLGEIVCAESELPSILQERPRLQVYLDTQR